MYRIKTKNQSFLCPEESIYPLALTKAMDNGIMHGQIHDEQTAIDYLTSIGFKIEKV